MVRLHSLVKQQEVNVAAELGEVVLEALPSLQAKIANFWIGKAGPCCSVYREGGAHHKVDCFHSDICEKDKVSKESRLLVGTLFELSRSAILSLKAHYLSLANQQFCLFRYII